MFVVKFSMIVATFPETLLTNKSAVYELEPTLTVAYPTIAPVEREDKSKEPPSV